MEEKVKAWLDTRSESTARVYSVAIRKYLEYTRMTGEELVAEIDAEFEKKLTERGEIERKVRAFYRWIVEEKELSENTGSTSVGAVMGFYRHYNYRVNVKIQSELKPTNKNRKVNLTTSDVRMLANHAKNTRDRAIILCMAQSGMDVSTICSLKVRDVWRGLEAGEVPLRLHLIRGKEAVEFDTFLAKDAIEAVTAYLRERETNGELGQDEPLFIKEGKAKHLKQPMQPNLIQKFFRQIAPETPLTSKQYIEENHWNPIRAHALRRFFSDRLGIAGANTTIIDYMLGHKLAYGGAYFGEAYNYYKDALPSLAIFEPSEGVAEVKEALMEQNTKLLSLYENVQSLQEKNAELEAFREKIMSEEWIDGLIDRALQPHVEDLRLAREEFNRLIRVIKDTGLIPEEI